MWYDFPKDIDKMRIPSLPTEKQETSLDRRIRRMQRGYLPVKKGQGKRQQARKGTSKAVATPQAPTTAAKGDTSTAKGGK